MMNQKCPRCVKTFSNWEDYRQHEVKGHEYKPMNPQLKKLIVDKIEFQLMEFII